MIKTRTNPHRLYRNRENAMLAGVCAGLADYFGFNRKGVRIVVILGAIFFLPFVAVAYLVLALLLPVKPNEVNVDKEKAEFWRDVSNAPADVFVGILARGVQRHAPVSVAARHRHLRPGNE